MKAAVSSAHISLDILSPRSFKIFVAHFELVLSQFSKFLPWSTSGKQWQTIVFLLENLLENYNPP